MEINFCRVKRSSQSPPGLSIMLNIFPTLFQMNNNALIKYIKQYIATSIGGRSPRLMGLSLPKIFSGQQQQQHNGTAIPQCPVPLGIQLLLQHVPALEWPYGREGQGSGGAQQPQMISSPTTYGNNSPTLAKQVKALC